MKATLSPQESATLIAKGISADKASMCQLYSDYDGEIIDPSKVFEDCGKLLAVVNDEAIDVSRNIVSKDSDFDHSFADDMPIFTLADLLELLPKELMIDGVTYYLNILCMETWVANYINAVGDDYVTGILHSTTELIDALYELLLWTIDNGHIDLPK